MITVECPWCAGPAHLEGAKDAEVACAACGIAIEIAPDPVRQPLERAA